MAFSIAPHNFIFIMFLQNYNLELFIRISSFYHLNQNIKEIVFKDFIILSN